MSSFRVITEFAGASLGEHVLVGDVLKASLRREAVVEADGQRYDYNRHFAFGLRNETAGHVDVDVMIETVDPDALPDSQPLLWESDDPAIEFEPSSIVGRTDHSRQYQLRVPLAPGRTTYVANYLFRPYPWLSGRFDRLARAGGGTREVFGTTLDGYDLVAYRYGDPGKPALLVTSAFHPTEGDTLGSEGVMEALASERSDSILAGFSVVVVPLVNPDGFMRGYNACNASEINFYWLFQPDASARCPEAHYLWDLVRRSRPVLYFDFHAYTFQQDRHHGPYLKPHVFYRGSRIRDLVAKIDAELLRISGGHAMRGLLTYAPSTMSAQITNEFNTITYAKYHLHLAEGNERNKRIAVECVEAAAGLITRYFADPSEILAYPHGGARAGIISVAGAKSTLIWGRYLRPCLGRAKRALMLIRRPQ